MKQVCRASAYPAAATWTARRWSPAARSAPSVPRPSRSSRRWDISDLQGDDVAELHRRLSGKGKLSEAEVETERVERKERFERMVSLVEAVVAEKRA